MKKYVKEFALAPIDFSTNNENVRKLSNFDEKSKCVSNNEKIEKKIKTNIEDNLLKN